MAKRRGRQPRTPAERAAFQAKMHELKHSGKYPDNQQRLAIAFSELGKGGLRRLKQNKGKRRASKRGRGKR